MKFDLVEDPGFWTKIQIKTKILLENRVSALFSLPYFYDTGPRQANLVLIAYASSEGSGEPAHPRSLARTSAARSYKQ